MEHQTWVSRYRDELKGLAILWVVLFHSPLSLGGELDWIRQLGYGGVDIFFFLMGMGLYRSLQKQEDLCAYASRRLWRILPAYLPVLIAWMVFMYPGYQLSPVQTLRGVMGNLTMTGYWIQTPKVFNWFANAQFLFILIAPICYAVLTRSRKQSYAVAALLVVAFGIGMANIGLEQMMGASRLPIFIIGMAFGMDWPVSARKGLIRTGYVAAFLIGLAAVIVCFTRIPILLIDFGMYWYPFVLMTPALCVGIAFLLHKAEKARIFFAPLRWIGQGSFEIYLLNIWTVEIAKKNGLEDAGWWALLCVGNVLAGIGYHRLVEWGTKRIHGKTVKQTALEQ